VELLIVREALQTAFAARAPFLATASKKDINMSVYTFTPCHRTWNCDGTIYRFSRLQSRVMEWLYLAWQSETSDISQREVLAKSDSDSKQLKDVFKRQPAWKVLVGPGEKKGTARLNIPPGTIVRPAFEEPKQRPGQDEDEAA
jgi:hypothetical protein